MAQAKGSVNVNRKAVAKNIVFDLEVKCAGWWRFRVAFALARLIRRLTGCSLRARSVGVDYFCGGLKGSVCACSTGRVGFVTGRKRVTFASGESREVWTGIGLDGKGLWCSSSPTLLYTSIDAYIARLEAALKQPGCVYPPLGSGSLNPIGAVGNN